MRESLIGRLNEDPPLPASKVDGFKHDHREHGWDWPSQAPSMIGAKRMNNVRSECERVLNAGVPGDFMETGVWRGGACIMMRAVLKAYRHCRPPGHCRRTRLPAFRRRQREWQPTLTFHLHGYKDFAVPLAEVKAAFARYGLLDDQVVFLEGLFKHTLPSAPVEKLAVLRLDGDMYESTHGRPRQPVPQAFHRRDADRRRLLSCSNASAKPSTSFEPHMALATRSSRSTTTAATGSRALPPRQSHLGTSAPEGVESCSRIGLSIAVDGSHA